MMVSKDDPAVRDHVINECERKVIVLTVKIELLQRELEATQRRLEYHLTGTYNRNAYGNRQDFTQPINPPTHAQKLP